jgi:hypothetical protein
VGDKAWLGKGNAVVVASITTAAVADEMSCSACDLDVDVMEVGTFAETRRMPRRATGGGICDHNGSLGVNPCTPIMIQEVR